MSKRIMQLLCIMSTLAFMAVLIPSTFSKYTVVNDFDIAVQTRNVLYYNTTAQVNGEPTGKIADITIDENHTGIYAVILKGGSGGRGTRSDGNAITTSGPNGGYINGGAGGVVFSCFSIKESCNLKCFIGSAGEDSKIATQDNQTFISGGKTVTKKKGDGVPGDGGINGSSRANGSVGTKVTLALYSDMDRSNVGPGGGAGTLLYYNSESSANLIAIAGGGGGGSSWDYGYKSSYKTKPSGRGGAGGNMLTASANGSVTINGTSNSGKYYNGSNAPRTAEENSFVYDDRNPCGSGGSNTGGYRGRISAGWVAVGFVGIEAAEAEDGKDYANNGTGGFPCYHGGGGGGGYCGGGGGAGTSIAASAAGGGGGSSFLADKVNGNSVITLSNTVRDQILTEMYSKSGYSLSNSEGFVILLYLGQDNAATRSALGIS